MNIKRAVGFFGGFVVARGSLFVCPIILASTSSAKTYGEIEFSIASATIASALLSAGTHSTIPNARLGQDSTTHPASIDAHLMGVSILLLCFLAPLAWLLTLPQAILFCTTTASILLQIYWSTIFKSDGQGTRSLFIDVGMWFWLLALTAILRLFSIEDSSLIGYFVGAYALILLAPLLLKCKEEAFFKNAKTYYLSTIHRALPLLTASIFAIIATTSGRFGIGLLGTPELVAAYAAVYRVTAIPIVAHQILITSSFRAIFVSTASDLDQRATRVVAAVAGTALIFWIALPHIRHLFGQLFLETTLHHPLGTALVLTQTILWSSIALNDLANNKVKATHKIVPWLGLNFVFTFPLAGWYLNSSRVDLDHFIYAHSALMAGYFSVQSLAMLRNGIRLTKMWSIAAFTYAAGTSTALLSIIK